MERIDTTTSVETPERVSFRFRLAGPAQRAVAWVIDLLVQVTALLSLAVVAAFSGLGGELAGGVAAGLFLLALFLVSWFYGAIFEYAWSGRTPGKSVMRLRVVGGQGGPLPLRDAVLRNLLRGVDALPVLYVVGGVVALFDRRLRRLGDMVADTMVVVEQRADLLDALVVEPPVSEAERQALPVRVVLSRDERHAVEALLRRRPRLHEARVEELARYLAPAVAERTGVEAPSHLRTLVLAWARATGRER